MVSPKILIGMIGRDTLIEQPEQGVNYFTYSRGDFIALCANDG